MSSNNGPYRRMPPTSAIETEPEIGWQARGSSGGNTAATPTAKTYTIGFYDRLTGIIIKQHSIKIPPGRRDRGVDYLVAAVFADLQAAYERLENDPAALVRLRANGETLFPLKQLKVAISTDPALLDADLAIDLTTGKFRRRVAPHRFGDRAKEPALAG